MNIFGKQSNLPFSRKSHHKKEKAWFPLCMSRILVAAKHSWTALRMSRPLFCRSHGGLPANEKKKKFASNDFALLFIQNIFLFLIGCNIRLILHNQKKNVHVITHRFDIILVAAHFQAITTSAEQSFRTWQLTMQLFMPGDTKENVIQDSKDQIAEFLTKTELKKRDSNQKKYCTVDVICLLRSICKKKHLFIS